PRPPSLADTYACLLTPFLRRLGAIVHSISASPPLPSFTMSICRLDRRSSPSNRVVGLRGGLACSRSLSVSRSLAPLLLAGLFSVCFSLLISLTADRLEAAPG